jgi:hypothetical protein
MDQGKTLGFASERASCPLENFIVEVDSEGKWN